MNNNDLSGRKLTDVFKELEQARYSYEQEARINIKKEEEKKNKKINKVEKSKFKKQQIVQTAQNKTQAKKPRMAKKAIPISGGILALLVVASVGIVTFSNSVMSKDSLASSDVTSYEGEEDVNIEINRHRLNAHNIIISNAALETVKEQVVEERDIPFETVNQECSYLPKDEKTTIQKEN